MEAPIGALWMAQTYWTVYLTMLQMLQAMVSNGIMWLMMQIYVYFPSTEGVLNLYLWYFADYDAPITESGDYTEKYYSTAIKILEYDPISSLVSHPDPPEIVPAIKYGDVQITEQMDYEDILSNVVSEQAINKSNYVPSFKFTPVVCCLIAILFPTSAYWTSGIVRKSQIYGAVRASQ